MGNCCSMLLDCNCTEWISGEGLDVYEKPDGKPIIEKPGHDFPKSPLPTLPSDDIDGISGDVLKVNRIELDIPSNGYSHNTDKYELMRNKIDPRLVIRRGQEFTLSLVLNRPFDEEMDAMSLLFTIGDGKPSFSNGTLVMVPLYGKNYGFTGWGAYLKEIHYEDNRIQIGIISPSDCPVGTWKIAVDTKLRGEYHRAISYSMKESIYILFNPWNERDDVYMEDEETRNECILEDVGLVWKGSHDRLKPTPWTYSQFGKNALECSLILLSGPGRLGPKARGNPIIVARALSGAVNSPDNDGLLEGNWTEDFSGGIKPSKFTGSLEILQRFYETRKSVKFAQCWVFAGCLTTICRALGIPSRVVTNYQSAHDTQASLTVDYFINHEGQKVEDLNTDSIWNFHVWNEVWMARRDIDTEFKIYSGWQVIDATPQEKSEGMFKCGPSPVSAVRNGEILRPFDSGFVFSEVNADKVYWRYKGPSKPIKYIGKKEEGIGLLISTKANGVMDRIDITDSYKYPEKSQEEREVMLNALKQSDSHYSRLYLNEDFNDVRFDFQLLDDVIIGQDFRVLLKVENINPDTEYSVNVILRIEAMLYTGQIKDLIKKENMSITIGPESEEILSMTISYDEYYSKLREEAAFNVSCLAKVDETHYEYFVQDDFRLRKPDIEIYIPAEDEIRVNEPFNGILTLKNPLPIELTRPRFTLDAPGFGDPIKIRLNGPIGPGESASGDFVLTPKVAGENKVISVKFTSDELDDCDGFKSVTVQEADDTNIIEE